MATSGYFDMATENQRNLDHYWRVFFMQGASGPVKSFFKVGADKVLALGAAAAGGGATAVQAALALNLPGALFAAAGPLVLGLALNGVRSYFKMAGEVKCSPYRYLTSLQDAGVTFRSGELANRTWTVPSQKYSNTPATSC